MIHEGRGGARRVHKGRLLRARSLYVVVRLRGLHLPFLKSKKMSLLALVHTASGIFLDQLGQCRCRRRNLLSTDAPCIKGPSMNGQAAAPSLRHTDAGDRSCAKRSFSQTFTHEGVSSPLVGDRLQSYKGRYQSPDFWISSTSAAAAGESH